MRVRTEERRQAILKAAYDEFVENGYEGATMSAITARVGGSKATLYGYFQSKDELLVAVVSEDIAQRSEQLIGSLERSGGSVTRAGLEMVAMLYLGVVLAPSTIALQRILISQAGKFEFSKIAYEKGIRQGWRRMSGVLRGAMERGELRQADPWATAMHLKGLLTGELQEQCLYGVHGEVDPEVMRATALSAVDAFFKIYGAENAPT